MKKIILIHDIGMNIIFVAEVSKMPSSPGTTEHHGAQHQMTSSNVNKTTFPFIISQHEPKCSVSKAFITGIVSCHYTCY